MPLDTHARGTRNHESMADVLLRHAAVEAADLQRAQEVANASGQRLELVLAEQHLVDESDVTMATAEYLGLPAVSLANFTPDTDLLARLPHHLCADLGVVPLAKWGSSLAVAVGDPFDVTIHDELRLLLEEDIILYVALSSEIAELTKRYAHLWDHGLADMLRDVMATDPDVSVSEESEVFEMPSQEEIISQSSEEPVIRIVNTMLLEALERRVSDIHIEPMENLLSVRYRIDGVLYDQPSPPQHMQWAITSRLKIIANLDITQRLIPQDGRFSIRAAGRDADIRLSLVSTVHGQKAVLRILDRANLRPDLNALGLARHDAETFERAIREPLGVILVTGPTGSGKTTTLYSILQELNQPGVNIVTIEDPVEYRIPRINQIPTNAEIGLTFAIGLRSILRQDPDIIMVGEIRDSETANIAVQASLTGHLVLSTLHTNDAAGAVARLVNMGVEPFLIASSLLLSQAQRIYRRLCHTCRRISDMKAGILGEYGLDVNGFEEHPLWEPVGCERCDGIGYRGRHVVMELLQNSSGIRDRILERASTEQIRDQARAEGMRTLREVALHRVFEGDTTLEEVLRVTGSK